MTRISYVRKKVFTITADLARRNITIKQEKSGLHTVALPSLTSGGADGARLGGTPAVFGFPYLVPA